MSGLLRWGLVFLHCPIPMDDAQKAALVRVAARAYFTDQERLTFERPMFHGEVRATSETVALGSFIGQFYSDADLQEFFAIEYSERVCPLRNFELDPQKIQDLANKIHAKAMEVRDLKNELELKKIRQGSSSKEVVIKSRFCFLPDSSLWCLLQVLALSEEVAAAKAALTDLKIQDKNLNAYQQALCDLRAAEDHRKPRSQPASPFTSPAMGPTSGALATSGGPPGSPSLAALTDPNFEGSKRLLPGADARKKEFDPIKVSPKWDKPETYQKVRGVRNV